MTDPTPERINEIIREARLAAQGELEPLAEGERRLRVTPASDIAIAPTHWLWDQRIPLGELTLLAGREGIGKSAISYDIAADVTTGKARGYFKGRPRSVFVAASEDRWGQTIVPRLMAANADLSLVYRVDVVKIGHKEQLTFPADNEALVREMKFRDGGLLLLDPLVSRLSSSLDTHKDAEVRLALEPLVDILQELEVAGIGLIHLNKTASGDALSMLMASRAFAAVARAVVFCTQDPDDDTLRLFGQAKNNLGPIDLPSIRYVIEEREVGEVGGEVITAVKVKWSGEDDRDFRSLVETAAQMTNRTEIHDAQEWLVDYLVHKGGGEESAIVKKDAAREGHNERTLKRAFARIKGETQSSGFPRKTHWMLPGALLVPTVSDEPF